MNVTDAEPRSPGEPHEPDGVDPHTKQLEVLNQIARIATLDLELRPMLQRITDALAREFEWELVALAIIDDDKKTFVCEAITSSAPTEVRVGYSRPLGSGVVGEVATTERAVLIDDVRTHPNYVDTMQGTMSELCVPVKHKGQLVAILNLESTRLGAFHTQLPVLTTIVDQIAGAIASARMYEELKQRARLMEMMSEVSRTALEATELNELLDRVVRYVASRFPLEIASVVLFDAEKSEFYERTYVGEMATTPGERWPLARGVIGRCIRSRHSQLVLDVAADPDYVRVNPRVAAELVVPIRFRDEILGVLNFESSSADVFTAANVLAFEAFADQVAGAIRLATTNQRLTEAKTLLDQKTQDLEQANQHLARAIETLHHISTMDGLTGLANRRLFDETYALEWRRAARARRSLALLLIDIDHFKAFNDERGHQAGDDCLRRVAQVLKESLQRAGDLVARYGGEEFVILMPDTDAEHARIIAERLREGVVNADLCVTISVGVAATTPERDAAEVDVLLRRADEALYEAKRLGRNRVEMSA